MNRIIVVVLIACGTFARAEPVERAHLRFVPADPKDPLPPWRYTDMTDLVVNHGRWKPDEVKALEILAWAALVDERPLYVNQVIFGVKLSKGRWALVQLGQNPIPTQSPTDASGRWNFDTVTDTSWRSITMYERKPTPEQVEDFLWYWDDVVNDDKAWHKIAGSVRRKTWQTFVGGRLPRKLESHTKAESR